MTTLRDYLIDLIVDTQAKIYKKNTNAGGMEELNGEEVNEIVDEYIRAIILRLIGD